MSVEELIGTASRYDSILFVYFTALPFLVLFLWVLHGRYGAAGNPWKYVYSVLVYAACIPGIFAFVLTGYTLFFLRASLLSVNAAVYFLPIASMLVTLILMRKRITFDEIPGFNKIQGLMLLLAATFVLALVLDRMRILLIFRGSFVGFLVLCVLLFFTLKLAVRLLFGTFGRR